MLAVERGSGQERRLGAGGAGVGQQGGGLSAERLLGYFKFRGTRRKWLDGLTFFRGKFKRRAWRFWCWSGHLISIYRVNANYESGVFFLIKSEISSIEASSRDLPFAFKSSKVLQRVSVMWSCVCSEPPRIENLSAWVILLCPSSQSRQGPKDAP